LQLLNCDGNQIGSSEIQQFKKEHQNCIVLWNIVRWEKGL
jgi:hypothetical protein